jgi:transposase
MKQIVFTLKDIGKIKEFYSNSLSCSHIGKIFDVSKTPIIKILKQEGLLKKGYSNGKKIILTNEQKKIIKNLYIIEKKNCKEIGDTLNLTESFINKYLGTVYYRRSKSEANSEYRKGKKLPQKTKNNMKIAQQKLSKSGNRKQTGGVCKIFNVDGIKCQGTYEKFYIEKLINENILYPKNCEPIITPYGVYYPDFSYGNKLIEIKSDYTYNILIGVEKSRFTNLIETNQLMKIKWVNENVLPVEIIVVDKRKNKIIKKEII